MNVHENRALDYLGHIDQAIERIFRYTEDLDEIGFSRDQLIQDAVIRNIEIIGEASRNLQRQCPDFVASHPELPLRAANEMRNALAHAYFKVEIDVVWRTIESDLPGLCEQVRAILKS